MPNRRMQSGSPWFAYGMAVGCAFLVSLVYWQARTDWRVWRQLTEGRVLLAGSGSTTLAWKQPILPAQFAQASCGACHHDELAQTPRLNHGRQLMVKFNCAGCHQLQDIARPAMLGPDLTNIGTKVTREWIYKWLNEPRTLTDANGTVTVDGVATDPRMPKFNLSDVELRALSAYLSVQRVKAVSPTRVSFSLARDKGKDQAAIEDGQTRFNQMFCVTCHSIAVDRGGEVKVIGGDIGPELTKVGSKVRPEWLVAWLKDPQGYLEHTKMPRFEWNDKDLYKVSEYLLYKLSDPELLKDVPQLGAPTSAEIAMGQRLFVEKGCAECHVMRGVTPRPNFGPDLSAMGVAGGVRTLEARVPKEKTFAVHFVRTSVERLDIGESVVPRSMINYVESKLKDPTSVAFAARMPRFTMSDSDRDDLTTAILSMTGPAIPNQPQKTIVERPHSDYRPDGAAGELYDKFRCSTCHMFRGNGGTLAPDLSYEGSRSNREWLVQFLMNPQTIRPSLTVRMPRFSMTRKDAEVLADYISGMLQKSDVKPSAVDAAQFTAEMVSRGKNLFETKYGCQSCHTIGSSGGYVGPSLNDVGGWLTAAWIEAWLRNPQALVPGASEPKQAMSESEIRDITAYLLTLKQAPATETAATGGQQ
ncbi:c-type cytochrome [Acidobacteria bacterium AB60]|nr:c-type cytochrome [Acidobacteria bacterium AB60]